MDATTLQFLSNNPKLLEFIRHEPYWYRYLSRDGLKRVNELEREAKVFYGKTLAQRMDRVNNQLEMASMLINMADLLKD
ncbi:YlbE-like family protein [Oceanobacillus sp. CAU 1775]